MIAYLIKSAVCLLLLLAAYHLLLEKEKMHRFNRFFLLAGMVFSLTIPAISIRLPQATIPIIPVNYVVDEAPSQTILTTIQPAQLKNFAINNALTLTDYLLIAYAAVAFILLIRFTKNLYEINARIRKGEQQLLENCTLVLVPEEIIPHSFFNYIFVNKAEYESGAIDKQLLLHELTHVSQKHSYDIVFIELLKIIFWFNPIFILYKKAIQLNHEFLADEGVLATHTSLKAYQHLLLSKAGFNHTLKLTSNFNYGTTKKRLIMMNRTTPKLMAMLKGIALAPVMLTLIFACCIKAKAMLVKNILPITDTVPQKSKGKGSVVAHRYKNGKIVIVKSYNDLSDAEKKKIKFPAPGSFRKPVKQSPNARQLQSWAKGSIYGIWLDGKHVKNETLANYTTSDIVYYTSSPLTKYATNYPKNYFQVDLYTEDGYNEAFKNLKK